MSRVLACVFAAVFLCAGAPQEADSTAPPVPTSRRADTYAVYSAALSTPRLGHADTAAKYLIARDAGFEREQRPDSCLALPASRRAEAAELAADFERLRGSSNRLERSLKLEKPYELLSPEEAESFMDPRRFPPSRELTKRLAGATDLITLGAVYFNRNRTLALVRVTNWCGRACGTSNWRIFEKSGGEWEERNWIRCRMMA